MPITISGATILGGVAFNDSASIVTSGLVLNLDAGNPASYPGSGTTWFDLSGNGNNGTLVNSPSYTTISGAQTFAFNGTNNRVSFTYQIPVQSTSSALTWGCWIRANRNFDGDVVMGRRGSTPLQFYKQTTQKFEMYPAEVFYQVPTATWIYVNSVWNGPQAGADNLKTYMYVNGVQVGIRDGDTPDFSPSPMVFNIGGDNVANEWFQGYIAAAHVYNIALTASQITENFNATRGRYGV
jgi:hypothetical protein